MTITKGEAIREKYEETKDRLNAILPGAGDLLPSLEEIDIADAVSLITCSFVLQDPRESVRILLAQYGLITNHNQFAAIMDVVEGLVAFYRKIV